MAERKPIISFRNFSFQYRAQKRPTLTDINLEIYPGERVLIAGPSGSGKSTLAGCINGLNPFSNPGACTGTLTVDGVDAPHSSLFELSAHVGTVLQDPDGQFIGLTVGEDIAFALENSCTPQDEMHAITEENLEKLLRAQFADLTDKYVHQFALLFLDLQKKCDSAEISTKALDLRGMLDALRLMRRGVAAGPALDMGITNKAFDSYEQGLIRDVIAARIPASLTAEKLFR